MFFKKIIAEQIPEHFDLQTTTVSEDQFKELCNLMLQGTKVSINGFTVQPAGFMTKYRWENCTLTDKNVPKALRKFRGTKDFYPQLIAYNTYIQQRVEDYIRRRTEYIQNLDVRNAAYRNIMECALRQHITAYSPCARSKYEAQAIIDYTNLEEVDPNPDCPLSDVEIENLRRLAPAFGLALPTNDYYFASREARKYLYDSDGNPIGHLELKPGHMPSSNAEDYYFVHEYKSHGYTEEIQRVFSTRPNYFPEVFDNRVGHKVVDKDYRTALHPDNLPEEWMVQHREITQAQWKKLKEQLDWFLSLGRDQQDEFIMEPYTRCPHCGQIVRKVQDDNHVYCELCDHEFEDEIITTPNDQLFYGTDIDLQYSNLDDVHTVIDDMDESDDYGEEVG